jgi:Dickkopf N-terminal cysteine-rich region
MSCGCNKKPKKKKKTNKKQNKARFSCLARFDDRFYAMFTTGEKVIMQRISRDSFKKLRKSGAKLCENHNTPATDVDPASTNTTCMTCTQNRDCGPGFRCRTVGNNMRVCLPRCNRNRPCPSGFTCVRGVCMPPPPSPSGFCIGAGECRKAVCSFGGRTTCQEPRPEDCGPDGKGNGLDDDCDGAIDEVPPCRPL